MIPQRDRISPVRGLSVVVEQPGHRILRGDDRERASAFRRDQAQARIVRDKFLVLGPREERPRGSGAPSQRRAGVAALRRLPQPFAKHLEVDVAELALSGRGRQIAKVGPIRANCRRRQPTHPRQVVGERVGRGGQLHPSRMPKTGLIRRMPRRSGRSPRCLAWHRLGAAHLVATTRRPGDQVRSARSRSLRATLSLPGRRHPRARADRAVRPPVPPSAPTGRRDPRGDRPARVLSASPRRI